MNRQFSWASLSVLFGTLLAATVLGFGQDQSMPNMPMPTVPVASPQEEENVQTGITLGELEQMALSSNPTLAQAAAEIRAAAGRKLQSGLYPNPTVGYQGEQIRGGSQGGGEQGFFVSQDIVLGGKLGLSRRVFEQERKQAEAEGEEQRLRVIGSTFLRRIICAAAAGKR
jgi:cobalt-zinc-cadmium efflux system outer membrane protein